MSGALDSLCPTWDDARLADGRLRGCEHALEMAVAKRKRRLGDAYRFPGFRPASTVVGVFGDRRARVIALLRRSKKQRAASAAGYSVAGTTATVGACATSPAAILASTWISMCGACCAGVAGR